MKVKQLAEIVQLIGVLHAAGAQRRLVQRREAHRIGNAALAQVETQCQAVKHVPPILLSDRAHGEVAFIHVRPVHDTRPRRRAYSGTKVEIDVHFRAAHAVVEHRAAADQQDVGRLLRGAVSEELRDELRPDTGGVAGEQCDRRLHCSIFTFASLISRPKRS